MLVHIQLARISQRFPSDTAIVAWCTHKLELYVLICLLASSAPGFASDPAYHTVAPAKEMWSPPSLLLLLALAGSALTCRAQANATRCFSINVDTLHVAFNYRATLLSFAGCDPASIKCASDLGAGACPSPVPEVLQLPFEQVPRAC